MANVLIVVDMQIDFLDGSLTVPGGKELIPLINKEINSGKYDYIIATKDEHPFSHKSFKLNGGDWPMHCLEGMPETEIHKDIDKKFDLIITKGMDEKKESYSAFFDESKKSNGLIEYFLENAIKEVYITGVALDYCVKHTALDSVGWKLDTTIISNCVAAIGNKEEISKDLESKGVNIE